MEKRRQRLPPPIAYEAGLIGILYFCGLDQREINRALKHASSRLRVTEKDMKVLREELQNIKRKRSANPPSD